MDRKYRETMQYAEILYRTVVTQLMKKKNNCLRAEGCDGHDCSEAAAHLGLLSKGDQDRMEKLTQDFRMG